MGQTFASVITGTGSYIPARTVKNDAFLKSVFYGQNGEIIPKSNDEIIDNFADITGIQERRYVTDDLVASDIAFSAAEEALASSGADRETLDYIIVAHNFGDVRAGTTLSDFVPSLASRVKHRLQIQNPSTVAYDLPFGCPGWLQGMIQADYYIRAGDAKRVLVIGTETLSRISDPHDMDSMIYADGAGATLVEAMESDVHAGILSHASRSDTHKEAYLLWMGKSSNPDYGDSSQFLKMDGHSVFKYALRTVPGVVKESLDRADLSLPDVNMLFLHQANAKMDEKILERLFGLYGVKDMPSSIMPMSIPWLGNSSVATVPTLLDLVMRGEEERLKDYKIHPGAVLVFASVGAGMNINSLVYRVPYSS